MVIPTQAVNPLLGPVETSSWIFGSVAGAVALGKCGPILECVLKTTELKSQLRGKNQEDSDVKRDTETREKVPSIFLHSLTSKKIVISIWVF